MSTLSRSEGTGTVVTTSSALTSHSMTLEEEELYFSLSMTLLRSLQQSDVPSAIKAAEAMSDMLGGALPEDSPARMLLEMRRPLEAFQKQQAELQEDEVDADDESDDEDESEDEESTDNSGDEDDEESEESEESEEEEEELAETVLPTQPVPPKRDVENELGNLLERMRRNRRAQVAAKNGGVSQSNKTNGGRGVQDTKVEYNPKQVSPSENATSLNSPEEIDHEFELCQEDMQVLLQIEAEVTKQMERLAVIRRHR